MNNEIKPRTVYLLRRTDKEDDGTDTYIGSTSRKNLNTRLCLHRCDAIRVGNENNRLYIRMRKIGLGNWEILPLLSRTCDRKTIRELERKWIGVLQVDLNTFSPITSKEERKENKMNYRKSNKQNKVHYCDVCDKSFECKRDLQKHFDSLKHQYTYLNSLD